MHPVYCTGTHSYTNGYTNTQKTSPQHTRCIQTDQAGICCTTHIPSFYLVQLHMTLLFLPATSSLPQRESNIRRRNNNSSYTQTFATCYIYFYCPVYILSWLTFMFIYFHSFVSHLVILFFHFVSSLGSSIPIYKRKPSIALSYCCYLSKCIWKKAFFFFFFQIVVCHCFHMCLYEWMNNAE